MMWRRFLRGIDVYKRQLPERYTCINAEEDLGLEGLRNLKQNMRPTGMNRMFEGEVRRDEA